MHHLFVSLNFSFAGGPEYKTLGLGPPRRRWLDFRIRNFLPDALIATPSCAHFPQRNIKFEKMPHLKSSKAAVKSSTKQERAPSKDETSGAETDNGESMLMSLAASAPKEAPREGRPGAEVTSRSNVTPSPYVAGPPHPYEHHHYYGYETHPPSWMGGVTEYRGAKPMGVYGTGARRLFPSPIRYARTKSDDEDVDESSSTASGTDTQTNNGYVIRGPPPHARITSYGPPGAYAYSYSYPPHPPPPYYVKEQYLRQAAAVLAPPSPVKKRPKLADPSNSPSPKRRKTADEPKPLKLEEEGSNKPKIDQGLQSPASGSDDTSKQRVISPSSSVEGGINSVGKSNDEEFPSEANEKGPEPQTATEGEPRHHDGEERARYRPQEPFYGGPQAPYPPPYYPSGPGLYGYPHPGRYGEGSPPRGAWRMPPSGAYPPPQVHVAPSPYPPPYAPAYGHPTLPPYHPRYHLPESHAGMASAAKREVVDAKPSAPQSSNAQRIAVGTVAPKIKSVAEWQRATLATGKAPSANRCVPLRAPIPSKYWGEAEKSKDFPIPDFHQLVNFPDYLNKVRPNGTEPANVPVTNNGKRPCVMCGKQRICSASSTSGGSNALRRTKKQGEEEEVDEDDTNHIIPRQNKGLCTACDISVWVFVESGLEIKWCKGCKNFRPWAAFGDKGLATKCVRCRDRQREKYAVQKDELRQRRLQQNRREDDDEDKEWGEKEVSEHQEIAAAKGLRDLMAASESI